MDNNAIAGFHHLTAIVGDPQQNIDFYARILGLRLVKRTVNFDDPGTYHLYYGDEVGRPGTLITFFPWPLARAGTFGPGQVVATSFAVPEGSLPEWAARLQQRQIAVDHRTVGGEAVLVFRDPDGLHLELV